MDWSLITENAFREAFSPNAIIFALAGMGLNLHFGYTGLPNFGQVAFVAAGAYSVAVGVATFGLSLWLAVFIGLLMALLLALILGVPTLRLRADYLAIVTIAAGEIEKKSIPNSRLYLRLRYSIKSVMSSPRCRSGGMVMVKTLSR